jgi:hypothetical protein
VHLLHLGGRRALLIEPYRYISKVHALKVEKIDLPECLMPATLTGLLASRVRCVESVRNL